MPSANNSSQHYAAAYIRYSSKMQDESLSLEAQERIIRRRAEQDGNLIVVVFADKAQSAYRNKYRPVLNRALESAKQGKFKILYVHKLDRLARRLEWTIEIAKTLEKYGVQLISVDQNFDRNTPDGKLHFNMMGMMAEHYSDNLSREVHKGKYQLIINGYHTGMFPWGYEKTVDGEKKKRVGKPTPHLKYVVHDLFSRYATGLYSDQQMADWLNQQGFRRSENRLFTRDNLRDILQNIYYAGKVRYRGAKLSAIGKNYRTMGGEIFEGKHDAIISMTVFNRCQAVRAERRHKAPTRQITRHVYYVNGMIDCVHCGRSMRAQSSRSHRYYREASKGKGYLDCPMLQRSVRADVIDAQIGRIMKLLRLPDNWESAVKTLLKKNEDYTNPEAERARIRKQIRDMREMKSHGLYEGEDHIFWRDVEVLQEKLSRLKDIKEPTVNKAAKKLLDIQKAWDLATRQEREELVKMLLSRVGCDIKEKRITWIEPEPEFIPLIQLMDVLIPQDNGKWLVPQSLTNGTLRDI
ncbi:MAG: recombinase family protein [Anaerolineales bacterium]|nr:recombinase family protein [Anaerolineales bacterium]